MVGAVLYRIHDKLSCSESTRYAWIALLRFEVLDTRDGGYIQVGGLIFPIQKIIAIDRPSQGIQCHTIHLLQSQRFSQQKTGPVSPICDWQFLDKNLWVFLQNRLPDQISRPVSGDCTLKGIGGNEELEWTSHCRSA
jgi:hypothetical protein